MITANDRIPLTGIFETVSQKLTGGKDIFHERNKKTALNARKAATLLAVMAGYSVNDIADECRLQPQTVRLALRNAKDNVRHNMSFRYACHDLALQMKITDRPLSTFVEDVSDFYKSLMQR